MGPVESQISAIGVDRLGNAVFLLDERSLTARADGIYRVGLGLHGSLHSLALKLQGALAHVLFDKAQTLFGMLLDPIQTLLEIRSPLFDILREQTRFQLRGDLGGQGGERLGRCRKVGAWFHEGAGAVRC